MFSRMSQVTGATLHKFSLLKKNNTEIFKNYDQGFEVLLLAN